jgi:hypothetical protein
LRIPTKEGPLYSLTIEEGITPKTDRYDRLALVRDRKAKEYKVVYSLATCPNGLNIVFQGKHCPCGCFALSSSVVRCPWARTPTCPSGPMFPLFKVKTTICMRGVQSHLVGCQESMG